MVHFLLRGWCFRSCRHWRFFCGRNRRFSSLRFVVLRLVQISRRFVFTLLFHHCIVFGLNRIVLGRGVFRWCFFGGRSGCNLRWDHAALLRTLCQFVDRLVTALQVRDGLVHVLNSRRGEDRGITHASVVEESCVVHGGLAPVLTPRWRRLIQCLLETDANGDLLIGCHFLVCCLVLIAHFISS